MNSVIGVVLIFFLATSVGQSSSVSVEIERRPPLTLTITNAAVDPSLGLPEEVGRLGFTVEDGDNNGLWQERYGVGVVRIPDGAAFDVVYQNGIVPATPTIVHAHGLSPPQGLDGVPYISALPLQSGDSVRYTFDLSARNRGGTYWLHAHYGFQLTQGVVAALVVEGGDRGYPLAEALAEAQDEVLLLEDYCPYVSSSPGDGCQSPDSIFAALQQDYQSSPPEARSCPGIEPATDMDVNWQYTLINRRPLSAPMRIPVAPDASALRLRFINAASTSHFLVSLPFDGALIVAADGQLVQPVPPNGTGPLPNSFWLAVGQRIDVLVNVSAVRAAAADSPLLPIYSYTEAALQPSMRAALLLLLDANATNATWSPPASKFAAGFMDFHTERALSAFRPLFPWPPPSPTRNFTLLLTGDNGFDSINGYGYQLPPTVPTYAPNPRPLRVTDGDLVAITFANRNDDPHPFHLHHSAFQVVALDGQQLPSPGAVRDTVLIPGGCRNVTVMFPAVSPGTWPIHCHQEFHQMAGMFTTLQYVMPSDL